MKNKRFIYDDSCPMCQWYTGEFIEHGLLEKDGRIPFSEADKDILERIDKDRCRHEIPLYDVETGETLYGYRALFEVIGYKYPIFKPLFRSRFFPLLIHPLYQLVSYNRRIIAGTPPSNKGFDCSPDFHLGYRSLYILLALLVSVLLALPFVRSGLAMSSAWVNIGVYLSLGAIGLVAALGIACKQKVSYWGHLATVLLVDNFFAFICLAAFSLMGGMSATVWILTVALLAAWSAQLFWKRVSLLN